MVKVKQSEINIGMVGHVDHGKTSLTRQLTGTWTDTHSEELKRGISIRLGYADCEIMKCPKCGAPEAYSVSKTCPVCGTKTKMSRKISFVDAPGHETLMATMLSGASLMNGAILVIAATEKCPQPQTKEHLMALDALGIENIIIVQNKIDLVDEERAKESYNEIKEFVKDTVAEKAPIIPISAHHGANIDILLNAIEDLMPTPEMDEGAPARLYVARSFDINKPGCEISKLKGGVIGGSIIQGTLNSGEKIEIKPGLKIVEGNKIRWESIITKITSLGVGGKTVKVAHPGGLVGIGTELDPALTKSDSLSGCVAGAPGTLPETLSEITVQTKLLDRIVGSDEELIISPLKSNEALMLNVGTATTVGIITSARGDMADMKLKLPICADKGDRIAMSRRIGSRWRLIGYGIIQ
ncbi:translation initiation factor IF-2 subunit gamma [Methanococcus aeolicus]|uniref:Translation initiation factor 2 subunit gamma n=1 Tax=Methanococcus aeolicus (strain ATCC BAA-1280 / DSM 17508 / OCM 812 / Nankai-3) TaxID=419665 RepID=IF2G_META3|nr:translation initiation factor IF-2 subunit gamma [Methanococcus aeolicus]A6UTL4.1 RecName: Full=Translation initiation factor 2 subunit gamma; AltName: Full=aIF2-gamma; AltName: Full=eIF-2-gamma [Methanococcus aeolicus Nankai-3]ABR55836.1 small GTP-binding protein [Methanococcus aeolicus Nankai-3]UXM84057.1 translation initiation factor IF-2 subunit gamma [Methanococcus aeolicus]